MLSNSVMTRKLSRSQYRLQPLVGRGRFFGKRNLRQMPTSLLRLRKPHLPRGLPVPAAHRECSLSCNLIFKANFGRVFTDKAITCSGSLQQPLVKTTSVCACPSSILMDELSGGNSPCGAYTSAQGDLLVVTNYCTTSPPPKMKRHEPTPVPETPDPAHPMITHAPKASLVGAKFRQQNLAADLKPRAAAEGISPREIKGNILSPRLDAGQVNIIIKGTYPCLGAPKASASGPNNQPNPTIASLCSNNEISAGAGAWTTYEVSSYMASLLTAAAPQEPTPTSPVDGAEAIHNDVNPPGAKCTYTSKCDSISCSNVKDYNTGTLVSIQRFLGYQAVVNCNNYLNSVYEGVLDSGTISSLIDANIVTTFYTNPTPDATWMQIMGIFTPLLGMFSAMLGPFSSIGSAALGVAGGIAGAVAGAATAASIQPVVDKRFDEYSSITDFVGHYLEATVVGLGHAYDTVIGPDTPTFEWSGSPYAPAPLQHGIFGDGYFANSDFSQDMTQNLLQKMIRIFTYKAINFAWVDSGVFIMYVPYGRDVMGPDGKLITGGINADYCNTKLQSEDGVGTLTVCDAPNGMARLFNAAGGGDSGDLTTPMGYDKSFNVLPNEPFSVSGAVKGSIASWQVGDFGYDASNPYNDAFNSASGLTPDQAGQIAKLNIAEETAGFFNIPVCQTWDLRYFPPASGGNCNACGAKTAVGGTSGSTVKFLDKVNSIVKGTLAAAGKTYCGGYYGTSCSNPCPGDVYTG